ncbi:hypothetical protein GCM10010236_02610 [Streptomyces eurythermus]|nr:hypothetical protein GCM10010236_02610 [Streptomyces eurythermus]
MRGEEDTPRHTDADRGAAADGALTLHAPLDATTVRNGSGVKTFRLRRADNPARTPTTTGVTTTGMTTTVGEHP